MKPVKFGNKTFDNLDGLNDLLPDQVTSIREGRRYVVRIGDNADVVGTRSQLVKAAIALLKNDDASTIQDRKEKFNQIKGKIQPLLDEKRSFLRRLFGFNPNKAIAKAEAEVQKQENKITHKLHEETTKLAKIWFKNNGIKDVSNFTEERLEEYNDFFFSSNIRGILEDKMSSKLLNQLTDDEIQETYLGGLQGAVLELKNKQKKDTHQLVAGVGIPKEIEPENTTETRSAWNKEQQDNLREALRYFYPDEADGLDLSSEARVFEVLKRLRDERPTVPDLNIAGSGVPGFVAKGGVDALTVMENWKHSVRAIINIYNTTDCFPSLTRLKSECEDRLYSNPDDLAAQRRLQEIQGKIDLINELNSLI